MNTVKVLSLANPLVSDGQRLSQRLLQRVVLSLLVSVGFCTPWHAQAQAFDAFLQPDFNHPELPELPRGAWLTEPELRIKPEFNQGSRNTTNYSVRFQPRSNGLRRLDQQIFQIENAQLSLQWRQRYAQLVGQRCDAVLTLAEAEAKLWQLEQRRIGARAQLTSAQALAAGRGRFGNASTAQQAILELGLAESRMRQQQQKVILLRKHSVGSYFEPQAGDIGLSKRLASPSQVKQTLQSLQTQSSAGSQTLQALKLESDYAAQRLALARSEDRFGLSLVELGYDDKQNDSYNLTMGFRLPSRRGSGTQARRVRELMQAEQEAHWVSKAYAHERETKLAALQLELNYYEAHVDALHRHRIQSTEAGSGDAATQQVLRDHEWQLQDNLIAQHALVLREFVDFLAFTGQLTPSTENWLRGQGHD